MPKAPAPYLTTVRQARFQSVPCLSASQLQTRPQRLFLVQCIVNRFVHSPRLHRTHLDPFHRFRSNIQRFVRLLRSLRLWIPSLKSSSSMRWRQCFGSPSRRHVLLFYFVARSFNEPYHKDFCEFIVYPFFRHRQPNPFSTQCGIRTRLLDPSMRIVSRDPSLPTEYSHGAGLSSSTLPNPSSPRSQKCAPSRPSLLYQAWANEVQSRGNVMLVTQRRPLGSFPEIARIHRRT